MSLDGGLDKYRKLRLYKGSLEYDDLDDYTKSEVDMDGYKECKPYHKATVFTFVNKDKYDGCSITQVETRKDFIKRPEHMKAAFDFKFYNATGGYMTMCDRIRIEMEKEGDHFVIPECNVNNPIFNNGHNLADVNFYTDSDLLEYTYVTLLDHRKWYDIVSHMEVSFRLPSKKVIAWNGMWHDLKKEAFDSTVQGIVRLLTFFNGSHNHMVLDMTKSDVFSYEELVGLIEFVIH